MAVRRLDWGLESGLALERGGRVDSVDWKQVAREVRGAGVGECEVEDAVGAEGDGRLVGGVGAAGRGRQGVPRGAAALPRRHGSAVALGGKPSLSQSRDGGVLTDWQGADSRPARARVPRGISSAFPVGDAPPANGGKFEPAGPGLRFRRF